MSEPACDAIKDLLPEWVAGLLAEPHRNRVQEHLAACPACREEEALLRVLLRARPEPPPHLSQRIRNGTREGLAAKPRKPKTVPMRSGKGLRHWTPGWALSAAALVVLSLGIGVFWNGENPEMELEPLEVAVEEPLPEAWLWDDAMVAGAPVYDDLSDEELEALLEELEG